MSDTLRKVNQAGKLVGLPNGVGTTARFVNVALQYLSGLGTVEINYHSGYGYSVSCLTEDGVSGSSQPTSTLAEAIAETVLLF